MFLESISHFGSATINLPLAQLVDPSQNIFTSIGVVIPAASGRQLADIGLFNYSTAEKVSKSLFESAGKTLTGHWMDCTGPYKHMYPKGVSVGMHRIKHHHFLTDAVKTCGDPNLNVLDFFKHLGTDVVTKNGLSILPESLVRSLASLLGTTPTKIMPWVSFNLVDIGTSVLAVSHSVPNVTSVITGSAQWSLEYGFNTFGLGTVKIAAGLQVQNPILVGSGATDITCGAITAHRYYSQPFFCGVPVADILQSASLGASLGGILGLVEVYLKRKETSLSDKVKLLGERITTSSLLSSMSTISLPLSVTTSVGLVGFSLAQKASESVNSYVKAIPIDPGIAAEIDQMIAEKYIEDEIIKKMIQITEPETYSSGSINQSLSSYLLP